MARYVQSWIRHKLDNSWKRPHLHVLQNLRTKLVMTTRCEALHDSECLSLELIETQTSECLYLLSENQLTMVLCQLCHFWSNMKMFFLNKHREAQVLEICQFPYRADKVPVIHHLYHVAPQTGLCQRRYQVRSRIAAKWFLFDEKFSHILKISSFS